MESVPVPMAIIAPVVVFFICHLGLAIWFAAKMSAKVTQISMSIADLTNDIKHMADMDSRILLLNQRLSRAEEDLRDVFKATALGDRA